MWILSWISCDYEEKFLLPWPHSLVWSSLWILPGHRVQRWPSWTWTWAACCYSGGRTGCPGRPAGGADRTASCVTPESYQNGYHCLKHLPSKEFIKLTVKFLCLISKGIFKGAKCVFYCPFYILICVETNFQWIEIFRVSSKYNFIEFLLCVMNQDFVSCSVGNVTSWKIGSHEIYKWFHRIQYEPVIILLRAVNFCSPSAQPLTMTGRSGSRGHSTDRGVGLSPRQPCCLLHVHL